MCIRDRYYCYPFFMIPIISHVPYTLYPRLPQDNMNVRVWNLECALFFLYFPVTRFMSNIYRFFWVLWSLIRELMNLNIVFTIVQMRKIMMNRASYMLQNTKKISRYWFSYNINDHLKINEDFVVRRLLSPYGMDISNWYIFKAH